MPVISRQTRVVFAALAAAFVFYVLSPFLWVAALGLLSPGFAAAHGEEAARALVLATSMGMATLAGLVVGFLISDRPVLNAVIVAVLMNVPMTMLNRTRSSSELLGVLVLDVAVTGVVALCAYRFRRTPTSPAQTDVLMGRG